MLQNLYDVKPRQGTRRRWAVYICMMFTMSVFWLRNSISPQETKCTCPITHCLLSYPRSGNHWVRYIIEALTDRPTYGCGPKDRPIYTNTWRGETVLPNVDPNAQPAAQKMHFTTPKSKGCSTHGNYCSHLIFIVRDPLEAIPRNLGRSKPWSKDEVRAAVQHYYSLVKYYKSFKGPKLRVEYESLMARPNDFIKQLAHHLGVTTQTCNAFLSRIDEHVKRSKNSEGKSWYGSVSNGTAKPFHWNRISADKQQMLLDAVVHDATSA